MYWDNLVTMFLIFGISIIVVILMVRLIIDNAVLFFDIVGKKKNK